MVGGNMLFGDSYHTQCIYRCGVGWPKEYCYTHVCVVAGGHTSPDVLEIVATHSAPRGAIDTAI